jgi:hypothetical protein
MTSIVETVARALCQMHGRGQVGPGCARPKCRCDGATVSAYNDQADVILGRLSSSGYVVVRREDELEEKHG